MSERNRPATYHFGDLSVVIPVAPGDEAWRALLPDLATLVQAEVIFAATRVLPRTDRAMLAAALRGKSWSWIVTTTGRAHQLNEGASTAKRDHLWFLHADSRFAPDTVPALRAALQAAPHALHYFDLAFLPGGPPTMPLNALGARIRSRWLGMPFGDQGLAIRRSDFNTLGGFDEGAPYGEDHLFVWRARRARIALRATGGMLLTSARKYSEHGWGRTTLRHLALTARQAAPEWFALVRVRVRGAPARHAGQAP